MHVILPRKIAKKSRKLTRIPETYAYESYVYGTALKIEKVQWYTTDFPLFCCSFFGKAELYMKKYLSQVSLSNSHTENDR